MRSILTLEESRNLDKELIAKLSLQSERLIENAGHSSAGIIKSELISGSSILFLIGPGNNGADGLVAAECLASEGYRISIYFYKWEKAGEANKARAASVHEYADVCSSIPSADCYNAVVEALFGFSFRGCLDDDVLAFLNEAKRVYALDAPAGFAYSAYKTITFTLPKKEFYFGNRSRIGFIDIVNPGFPESELEKCGSDIHLLDSSDISRSVIPPTAYKNTRGHAALLAGSDNYPGAALLASRSLYKSGAGLVSLYSSDAVLDFAISSEPGIIRGIKDSFSGYDSILIGPGWGKGGMSQFEKAIGSGVPYVIDADGLALVRGRKLPGTAVLTPHIGEYRKLLIQYGIEGGLTERKIKMLAASANAVVAVKSSVVYISDGCDIYIYDGENPALGIAGSGDILSGVIASALARGIRPLQAAIDGVVMHQMAGKELAAKNGLFTASELLEEIGKVCFRYIFSL